LKVSASFARAGIAKSSRHDKASAINFISIPQPGFERLPFPPDGCFARAGGGHGIAAIASR
jgi:hypothetical protein